MIKNWHSDNIEIETMVETLNAWGDPISIEIPSDSYAPSIKLTAEPSYLSCSVDETIRLTAKAKTHNCFPLSSAEIKISALASGLELEYAGHTNPINGKTDEKGDFITSWSYSVPASCGGSITFSATFNEGWLNLYNSQNSNCKDCIIDIPSTEASTTLYMMNGQADNEKPANSIEATVSSGESSPTTGTTTGTTFTTTTTIANIRTETSTPSTTTRTTTSVCV